MWRHEQNAGEAARFRAQNVKQSSRLSGGIGGFRSGTEDARPGGLNLLAFGLRGLLGARQCFGFRHQLKGALEGVRFVHMADGLR